MPAQTRSELNVLRQCHLPGNAKKRVYICDEKLLSNGFLHSLRMMNAIHIKRRVQTRKNVAVLLRSRGANAKIITRKASSASMYVDLIV